MGKKIYQVSDINMRVVQTFCLKGDAEEFVGKDGDKYFITEIEF